MATLTQTRPSPIHPLLVCASMLLCAAGCAPAPESLFPGTDYGRIDLSASASSFYYCGLEVPRPYWEDDLFPMTGLTHWSDSQDGDQTGFTDEDQPDEPDRTTAEEMTLEELREARAKLTREAIGYCLAQRVDQRRYRQMLALLETHLYDWKRVAILELYAAGSDRCSYIALAETPRGWLTATDLAPWSPQLDEWGFERRRDRPLTRVVPAQAELAEAFFKAVAADKMPNVALVGMAGGEGAQIWAILHVFDSSQARSAAWRLAVIDQDAWLMLQGVIPPEPLDVGPEVLEAMRPEGHGQPDHFWPNWKDVLLDSSQHLTYERLRAHFMGKAALFWQASVGHLDRKEDGWERALRAIRTDDVHGAASGEFLSEGTFWRISRGLLRVASNEDYYALLKDENVKVRALAMTCLAEKDRAGRVDALASRLEGRESFRCFPLGCVGGPVAEGELALSLIHNARFLQAMGDYAPALPRREQLALDLDVLQRDAAAAAHDIAGNALSWAVHKNEVTLAMPELRRLAPELSDMQIVKAVGRMRPEQAVSDFLLGCLKDASLSRDARLAAASALTRYPRADVEASLTAVAGGLDADDPDRPGSAILAQLRLHRQMAERVERIVVKEPDSWDGEIGRIDPANAAEAVALLEVCDPALFTLLEVFKQGFRSWEYAGIEWEDAGIETDDRIPAELAHEVLTACRNEVVALSRRLAEWDQPWDTYSDLGYELDLRYELHTDRLSDFFSGEDDEDEGAYHDLSKTTWQQVRDNVQAYLKARESAAGR